MFNFVCYIALWRLAVASCRRVLAVASRVSSLSQTLQPYFLLLDGFSYSLTALKLISRPLTEWVNAPTEMKSTPHSP